MNFSIACRLGVVALGTLAMAGMASAAVDDELQLTDGAGDVVTISDTGVVTISGACTAATCSTTVSAGTNSSITWDGKIGTFTFNVTTGTAPGTSIPPTILDLNTVDTKSTAAGVLTILYSANGITGATGFQMQAGGTAAADSTVDFTSYYNPGGALLATNTLIGDTGALGPGAFSATVGGAVLAGAGPYGLTEKLVETFTGAGQDSGDFALNAVPEPASVSLLGGVLLLVAGTVRRRMRA